MKLLRMVSSLIVVASACSQAFSLTYNIKPVALSEGYSIAGGHITTDGTLGLLGESNILDYRVEVDGSFPFVFHTANNDGAARITGIVEASPTSISVPMYVDQRNRLSFLAEELSFPGCYFCNESLGYSQSFIPFPGNTISAIRFQMVQPPDFGLNLFVSVQHVGDSLIPIVVAFIPEPTTCTLAVAALCLAMGVGHNARRVSRQTQIENVR